MKSRIVLGILIPVLLLPSGCSSIRPIPLDPQFWQQQGKKIGVVLLTLPPAETTKLAPMNGTFDNTAPLALNNQPWLEDMTYEPLRLDDMKTLQKAVLKLDASEFSLVQDLFVNGLKKRGFSAFKVDQPVLESSLPRFGGRDIREFYERTDFRGLAKSYGADYLIVIDLVRYGPYCHYVYAYNDHMAVEARVRAELIDASTNRVLWRTGGKKYDFSRPVNASCGNEDDIPVISEALRSLLEKAARSLSRDFFAT
ncbi:MAG TPA: hypothetical protein PLN32_06505 [Methanoregulaceae archaeon]|nr:hypothetical protein [Methanoregulaceae archaeon]